MNLRDATLVPRPCSGDTSDAGTRSANGFRQIGGYDASVRGEAAVAITLAVQELGEVVIEVSTHDFEESRPEPPPCAGFRAVESKCLRDAYPVALHEVMERQESLAELGAESFETLLSLLNRSGETSPPRVDREWDR